VREGDLPSLDVLKEVSVGTRILSASLHPTSDRFVAGGADCHLHVHDIATGQELGRSHLVFGGCMTDS
jgi:hypothetical protein